MINTKKTILVISNGEAEDAIACSILQHLDTTQFEFIAAPLVSHGGAYLSRDITICCPTASLPSCGFSNQSIKALKNDFHSGLGSLILKQYKAIRKVRHKIYGVITCGDVLPQIMGLLTGKPFVSIFTALSEYYIREQHAHRTPFIQTCEKYKLWQACVFTQFDRLIMKSKRCQGVFVRDQLTCEILQKCKVSATFAGNPMMDNLERTKVFTEFNSNLKTLLLLPGSRTPEVYHNLKLMIESLHHLKMHYNIAVAIASNIDLEQCNAIIQHAPQPVFLLKKHFSELLNQADTVLSMCGTAAEQAVGKGLPVVSMPGKGPQFTYKFTEAQQRLLGESYQLVTTGAADVAHAVEQKMNLVNLEKFKLNGLNRMGTSGGSERIASKITEIFLNLKHPPLATKLKESS